MGIADRAQSMPSEFPVVRSAIDASSEQCVDRQQEWRQVLSNYEQATKWCVSEGEDKYTKRHAGRGMLLG